MTQELLYTSAPRGLKPGSRGYCTVASTQSMSAPLARVLESLSGYRHVEPPGDPANPVACSHVALVAGGRRYQVVSRVCDSGHDYTGRSNKLAHHVVLEAGERPAGGPGWLISRPGFLQDSWEGEPRLLPSSRPAPGGDSLPSRCTAWQDMTGDAGWAGVLAEAFLEDVNRQVFIVFEPGMELLPLLEEAIALLPPDRRWEVTFNTFATSIPAGVECRWRCVLAGSPEANQSRRHVRALRIDLTEPLPEATGGSLVEVARTGKRPVAPVPRSPAAMPPPHPATATENPLADPAGTYGLGRTPAKPTRPVRLSGQSPPRQPGARSLRINPLVIATVVLLAVGGGLAARYWKPGSTAPVVEVASAGQQASTPADTAAPGSDNKGSKTIAPPEARKVALGGPPPRPEPKPAENTPAESSEKAGTETEATPSVPAKEKTGSGPRESDQPAATQEAPKPPASEKPPEDKKKTEPGQQTEYVVYANLPADQTDKNSTIATIDSAPTQFHFTSCTAMLFGPESARGVDVHRVDSEIETYEFEFSKKVAGTSVVIAGLAIARSESTSGNWDIQFRWRDIPSRHQVLRLCALRVAYHTSTFWIVLHKPRTAKPLTVGLPLSEELFKRAWDEAELQLSLREIELKSGHLTCKSDDSDDAAPRGKEVLLTLSTPIDAFSGIRLAISQARRNRPSLQLRYALNPDIAGNDSGFSDHVDVLETFKPLERSVLTMARMYWDAVPGRRGRRKKTAKSMLEDVVIYCEEELKKLKTGSNQALLYTVPRDKCLELISKLNLIESGKKWLETLKKATVVRGVIQLRLVSTSPDSDAPPFYADLIRIRPAEGSTAQDGQESDDNASEQQEPAAAR